MNNSYLKESALRKVNTLIKQFNATFTIEANITTDENTGEQITNGLRIKELKNDGTEFVDEIFDTLASMVHIASDEHELVYDKDRGFAIAKKRISYVIED